LAATIAAVHAARVSPPSRLAPGIPPELDKIVLRALAKKAGDRYQTAQEIVDDLWPLYSGQSRGATAELIKLVQSVAPAAALGRRTQREDEATAPARAPHPHPQDDRTPAIYRDLDDVLNDAAGDEEDFDALEDINGAPERPGTSPRAAHPTWSEGESLSEAAFEGSVTRHPPVESERSRRETTVTAIVIAASIIATIVFWLMVLK
jgi:hypothetical protein